MGTYGFPYKYLYNIITYIFYKIYQIVRCGGSYKAVRGGEGVSYIYIFVLHQKKLVQPYIALHLYVI